MLEFQHRQPVPAPWTKTANTSGKSHGRGGLKKSLRIWHPRTALVGRRLRQRLTQRSRVATTETPGDLQLVKVGPKPAAQPPRPADPDKKKKRPIWHNKLGD